MKERKMSLTLHKTKGVNPHLTCCRNCGKDVGIVLLGIHSNVHTCGKCGMNHVELDRPFRCKGCNTSPRWVSREIDDHEKLYIEICEDCNNREQECKSEVEKGGVYWRCQKCQSSGAIKANHPLADRVREAHNIYAPNPCGLEFDGDCPVCQQRKNE